MRTFPWIQAFLSFLLYDLTSGVAPIVNISIGTHFAGTTVWGGMIQTDPKMSSMLGRDFHKVPQGVKGTPVDNANIRLENGRKMIAELPFHVRSHRLLEINNYLSCGYLRNLY